MTRRWEERERKGCRGGAEEQVVDGFRLVGLARMPSRELLVRGQEAGIEVFASRLQPHRDNMPIPPLPIETTTEIIRLAMTDLVERERHQLVPTPSATNAFLLAASLVSNTWHSIAQPELLHHGLVATDAVQGFLERLDEQGMLAMLTMARFGPRGRNVGHGGNGRRRGSFGGARRRPPGTGDARVCRRRTALFGYSVPPP